MSIIRTISNPYSIKNISCCVSCNVENVIRHIRIHQNDADWQIILWKYSSEDPITEYCIVTVTFWTTYVPLLFSRTLHQLALDEEEIYLYASNAVLRHFNVDTLVSGAASREEAVQLVKKLQALVKKGDLH
ncbi:integrase catalytic domain-containing protein [Nephila pilipes]|uniref:Integrase catalytic domain-containing protein n=1 Tax=Nephila pilipes TaxID=299642 RepID=A0A8X6N417_NEPPI|nr:integrase catalytic domain-containing protein [Nephila pilipes]